MLKSGFQTVHLFDEKINPPGSQKVQVVLALLSLQQVPTIDRGLVKGNEQVMSAKRKKYLTARNYTTILTAGPGGPAAPVSPSFPDRPCSERSI